MKSIATYIALAALFSTPVYAEIITKDIEYEHNGTALVGYLAYDDSIEGKRPGVLVVHEWWGLNDYAKRRARMLAELGYVAFAADMYGKGKATADPSKASEWAGHLRGNVGLWRARALRGIEILKKQDVTDTERLAAIGYCFGGSTVLHLAYAGAPLKAVVSFHGGLPTPADDAEIKAAIVICHGASDQHAEDKEIIAVKDALNKHKADWLMIMYGNARHSYTNPAVDEHGIPSVRYNEKADKRSWQHMKEFLSEALKAAQ